MRVVSSILAVSFLILGNLSALEPPEDEILLAVQFDKGDLKIKEPYPVIANLVITRKFETVLSYGGGVMSDFEYTLSRKETGALKSLLEKFAAFERKEKQPEKVQQFHGKGKTLVEGKALKEIEAFGLEITTKILKRNKV